MTAVPSTGSSPRPGARSDTPAEVLDRRCAAGEIDEDRDAPGPPRRRPHPDLLSFMIGVAGQSLTGRGSRNITRGGRGVVEQEPSRVRLPFRTRVWRPAIAASGIDFDVRVHDLRHAHASWRARRRLRPQVRHGPHGSRSDHHHPEASAPPPRRRPHKNLTALDRIRRPQQPTSSRKPGAGSDQEPTS